MEMLADKLKVDKSFIVVGAAALIIGFVFAIGFGHFIIDLIGFVYPVYASIKAIETDEKEDDTQWLTYWLIFAFFKVFEGVADSLVAFIPFYFLAKVLFLVWCYYPTTKGASVLYASAIKPYIVPLISGLAEGESNKTK